jgi:hypothetical protein
LGDGGGEIIAINHDGTERWRELISNGWIDCAPIIGEDGTVYIGSSNHWPYDFGILHAFGPLDPNAPLAPTIDGPKRGLPKINYEFTFQTTSPLGNDLFYWIDWGDYSTKKWFGPFASGEKLTLNHTWNGFEKYTIRTRAKDTENLWGSWSELEVNMPRDKTIHNSLIYRILEQFPLLQMLIQRFGLQ